MPPRLGKRRNKVRGARERTLLLELLAARQRRVVLLYLSHGLLALLFGKVQLLGSPAHLALEAATKLRFAFAITHGAVGIHRLIPHGAQSFVGRLGFSVGIGLGLCLGLGLRLRLGLFSSRCRVLGRRFGGRSWRRWIDSE